MKTIKNLEDIKIHIFSLGQSKFVYEHNGQSYEVTLNSKLVKKNPYPLHIETAADLLHRKTCHWNHTDVCAYEYENWGDPGSTKKEYVEKVQKMISAVGYDQTIEVLELL